MPLTITNVSVDTSNGNTTLTWNSDPNAVTYRLTYVSNLASDFINGLTTTSHIFQSLAPGNYAFKVRSYDSNGTMLQEGDVYSDYNIYQWGTSSLPVITSAVVSPGKITLTWTQDNSTTPPPTKYRIEGSGTGQTSLLIDNIDGTLLTYDVDIVTPSTYTFNISTLNGYSELNQGSQNYPLGGVEITAKPYAPTNFLANTTALPNSIVLKWTQPSGNGGSVTNPSTYEVYVLDSSSMPAGSSPFTISAPATTTTLGPFSAGPHTVTLRAVDSNDGFSETSLLPVTVIATDTAPAPQMISASTDNPGQVTINWIQAFGDSSIPTADAVTFKIDYTVDGVSGTAIGGLTKTSPGIIHTENSLDARDEYNYTLNGLTEGAIFTFKVTSYSARETPTESTTSEPLTIQTTASGGGGGGGGKGGEGNNGATGYNNMATLEFAYDGYTGGVAQNTTVTVLGEEGGALTYDELITVAVPLAKFKKVVEYAGSWTGYAGTGGAQTVQSHPSVLFQPCATGAARDELQAMYEKLSINGTGAMNGAGRSWFDDATGSHYTFGNVMLSSVVFTGSVLEDDEMPAESIREIAEGGVTGPAIVDTLTTLDSTAVDTNTRDLLRGLFEQAVASGKVKTTDDADGDYKTPSFAAGDSITFLVKYTFEKTRTYQIDSVIDGTGNELAQIAPSRITITYGANNTTFNIAADVERSLAYSRTYAIKLLATAM